MSDKLGAYKYGKNTSLNSRIRIKNKNLKFTGDGSGNIIGSKSLGRRLWQVQQRFIVWGLA
jgi:hypothetical protein